MRPQYKAEHMAAPDQSVKRPKTLLPRRRRPHRPSAPFLVRGFVNAQADQASGVRGIRLAFDGMRLIENGLVAVIQAGQFLHDPASGPSC
jgi:hypothetical protein